MKKRLLTIFLLIFVLNTVALAALAAPCPNTESSIVQKPSAELPPCHKQVQGKAGHCKGICFCLHAQLSHSIIPFEFTTIKHGFVAQKPDVTAQSFAFSLAHSPPLKPPQSYS